MCNKYHYVMFSLVYMSMYIVFTQEDPGLRESSYELCYNHSCYLIGQGDMSGAQEKLRKAEGIL